MTDQISTLPAWQEKIGCFTPNFITEKVMDKDVHFYPVSVGLMFKLREVGRPLARSLAVLFAKNEADMGSKNVILDNVSGGKDQEISVEPISEGLAKIRHEQRVDAIEGIVTSLTDPKNVTIVGEIIMDSMRDVFPRGDNDNPPAQEFMQQLPVPALTGCLIGVGKANKGVFGPLADQVADAIAASVARIAEQKTSSDEPVASPSETVGSASKTA